MASTFQFCGDFGASQGVQARGTTQVSGLTNVSFQAADTQNSDFSSNPISAGSNSYDKFIWGLWTGSYNQISSIKFQRVSGVLGAGLQFLFNTGSSGFYRTPAQNLNSALTVDLTSTGLLSTGISVFVGGSGPNVTGKGASTTANPAYSSFIAGQLLTTVAASAGNTVVYTYGLQWLES